MRRATMAACLLVAAPSCDRRACDADAAVAAWQCGANCTAGALRWQQVYQGGITAYAGDAVIDACGGIVVVGSASPDRTSESHEAFVARYRADGELAWLRVTEAFGDDWAAAAAPTADGGIIVVGGTLGKFTHYEEVDRDTWVARYEVDGTLAWSRTFDDGERGGASDVAIDRHDRPLMVGRAGIRWLDEDGRELRLVPGESEFGWSRVAAAADGRLAVASHDAVAVVTENGVEQWRHTDTGLDSPDPRFLSDGSLLVRSGATLEVFDAAGKLLWSRTIAVPSEYGWTSAVAVDASDRIAIAGTEVIEHRRRAWVAALTTDGQEQWRRSIELEVPSEAAGLIAGPDGSLVVVASLDHGEYAGGIDQDVWLGRLHR